MTESLVSGRAKRSTAGNRMKELLEQALDEEEIFEEVQDDVEFEAVADEPDIIDSDFDQETEDEGEEDEEAGERELEEQEKEARKASRAKAVPLHMRKPAIKQVPAKRSAAAASGAAGATSTSAAGEASSSASKEMSRAERIAARRIAFIEGATEASRPGSGGPLRSSSRKATALKKAGTMARIRDEEAKKAAAPIKAPLKKKAKLTQDALIAEALEMEESNRASLRRFFEQEEQRKAQDLKKFTKSFEGPWIRWRSVATEPFVSPIAPMLQPTDRTGIAAAATAAALNTPTTKLTEDPAVQARREAQALKDAEAAKAAKAREGGAGTRNTSEGAANENGEPSSSEQSKTDHRDSAEQATAPGASRGSAVTAATQAEDENQGIERPASINKVVNKPSAQPSRREMRNFISIHGLDSLAKAVAAAAPNPSSTTDPSSATSSPSIPIGPTWADEFRLLLGDHCQWDSPIIVPARNRPAKPRQSTCVITGLPALYKDPKTGIAFATAEAYGILRELEEQRYLWVGEGLKDEGALGVGDDGKGEDGETGKRGKRKGKGKGREIQEDGTAEKERKVRGEAKGKDEVRPLAMGCYLGRPDDEGADGILAKANAELRRAQSAEQDKTTLDSSGTEAKEKVQGVVSSTVNGRPSTKTDAKAARASTSASGIGAAAASDPPSSSSTSSTTVPKPRPKPGWSVVAPSTVPAVAPGDEKALVAKALKLTSRTRSGRASKGG